MRISQFTQIFSESMTMDYEIKWLFKKGMGLYTLDFDIEAFLWPFANMVCTCWAHAIVNFASSGQVDQ